MAGENSRMTQQVEAYASYQLRTAVKGRNSDNKEDINELEERFKPSVLHIAVKSRNKTLVTNVLQNIKNQVDLSKTNEDNLTALSLAVDYGYDDIALLIFKQYIKENQYEENENIESRNMKIERIYVALNIIADAESDNEIMKKALNMLCTGDGTMKEHRCHTRILNWKTPTNRFAALVYSKILKKESLKNIFEIYCEKGDVEMVELLLRKGTRPRCGTLHKLVKFTTKNSESVSKYIDIYRLIVKYSKSFEDDNQSWRNTKERTKPTMKKWLTEKSPPHKNMDVIEYACANQAVELLDEILNTEGVLKFTYPKYIKYDVTNFTPMEKAKRSNDDTLDENDKANPCRIVSSTDKTPEDHPQVSYLETILAYSHQDMERAAMILDKEPFHSLTKKYCKFSKLLTTLMLCFHIFDMICFTYITWKNFELPLSSSESWEKYSRYMSIVHIYSYWGTWFVLPIIMALIEVSEFLPNVYYYKPKVKIQKLFCKNRKHNIKKIIKCG